MALPINACTPAARSLPGTGLALQAILFVLLMVSPCLAASAGTPLPRLGILQGTDDAAVDSRAQSFIQTLGQSAHLHTSRNPTTLPATPAVQARVTAPAGAELAAAASSIMGRQDIDLVLAGDSDTCLALALANNVGMPVVALSPDCTANIFPDKKTPENFLIFSPHYYTQYLRTVQSLVSFTKLGLIAAPSQGAHTQQQRSSLATQAAEALAQEKDLTVFFVTEMPDTAPETCREAIDSLFFDEIDALILDGSGCFEPTRPDFAELMDVLRQRGIIPLSLTRPDLVPHGALLGPWANQDTVLGRELALATLQSPVLGMEFAWLCIAEPCDAPLEYKATDQPRFGVNLAVAERMAFDLPIPLLALTEDVFSNISSLHGTLPSN